MTQLQIIDIYFFGVYWLPFNSYKVGSGEDKIIIFAKKIFLKENRFSQKCDTIIIDNNIKICNRHSPRSGTYQNS